MKFRYCTAGIIQNGEKIIIGRRIKGTAPYPDTWFTPGGGVNDFEKAEMLFKNKDYDNEYLHSELKREMREETNIEIKNIRNIVPQYRVVPREAETQNKHGEMTHYYFLEYLCDYESGELKAGDDAAEVKWVDKSELKNVLLTPPSKEMYKELRWL